MSSSYFQKPENALRRAGELVSIHQTDAALALLHDTLSSRRHKTWSLAYEAVMIQYLDLCLQLGKAREAKDGLHQYRNLSQTQAPQSLEVVIRHLVDQAEKKCADAQAKADKLRLLSESATEAALTANVEDLDASSTPQSILLSTMNTDPEQTQRETSVVLPHLKFLWETYRAVLDILRSNSKLEHLYHTAALGALRFCKNFRRKTEFRRLCEMLRMHLGNLQKYGVVVSPDTGKGKLRGWEGWTPESIELHLQTRFAQLETASALELYTEGFRTTEDIYLIMQISKRTPKAKLMATYYEKLIGIFWVSENLLFHAFAWYKYYTLCKEFNKSMTTEMTEKQATCVLLAALSIPSLDGLIADGNASADMRSGKGRNKSITTIQDDIAKEKTARMATLLGFQTHPTRSALLAELKSKGVIRSLPQYLQELYYLLEEHSDPLTLVSRAAPLLNEISNRSDNSSVATAVTTSASSASSPNPARYVGPLQNVILLKLIGSLSATYHTVSLSHLKKLTDGLGLPFEQVEKVIVVAQRNRVLVKIDHVSNALRFGSVELESDELRGHLQTLAVKLSLVADAISPSDKSKAKAQRLTLFNDVRNNLKTEHKAILERKNEIERRKEEVERLVQEKHREELQKKAEIEAARKAEEARRLALESRMREKEKSLKIQQEMEEMEKKKYLKALGKAAEDFDEAQLATMDAAQLAKEHADRKNKEKEEAERKLKDTAKRLDHITRAIRIEEVPLILKSLEERRTADRERYEIEIVEKAKMARQTWEQNIILKDQLDKYKVFNFTSDFETIVMKDLNKAYDALCRQAEESAKVEAEGLKRARAMKRMKDEQKRKIEEIARLKAEEEARKKEDERRAKEEELERTKAEEEERQRVEREKEKSAQQVQQSREKEDTQTPVATGSTTGRYVAPAKRSLLDRSSAPPPSSGSKPGGGIGYGGGRYEKDKQSGDSRGNRFGDGSRWGRN